MQQFGFYIELFIIITLAQVFSCEFCEISKNTFLHRTPLVAASDLCYQYSDYVYLTLLEKHDIQR